MESGPLHIYALAQLHGLQLAGIVVAVAAVFVALTSFWRRQRAPLAPAHRGPARSRIVYEDAPTTRIFDAQRFDRTRRVVRLTAGAHMDLLETRIGVVPRFRITLRRVVASEGGEVAHITVDFGGVAVSCGPLVEEIAFNEFALPRANRDESRNCVFHCQDSGDTLSFMRIKVRAIDAAAGLAEFDVIQVEGRWPTAGEATTHLG